MAEERRDDDATRETPQPPPEPPAESQDQQAGGDPLESQGAGEASDDPKRGTWLEESEQPTRAAVTSEPEGEHWEGEQADEEYRWHTGLKRDAGVPDAVEFIDVHKAFGRNRI